MSPSYSQRASVGVEPLFESGCLVLFQGNAAGRAGDVAASDGEMDDKSVLASRLDAGHPVDVDVRAIACSYDGHDRFRIRLEGRRSWLVSRAPLFYFSPLPACPCVLGGSIIARMG